MADLDRQTASALLVIAAMRSVVSDEDKRFRATLEGAAIGDKLNGSLPDGTSLGTVLIAKGAVYASIENRLAFTDWVATHFPDEIVHTASVRPSFEKAVTTQAQAQKKPEFVDPKSGEFMTVPGLKVKLGKPTTKVSLGENAVEAVAAAMRDGRLALPGGAT